MPNHCVHSDIHAAGAVSARAAATCVFGHPVEALRFDGLDQGQAVLVVGRVLRVQVWVGVGSKTLRNGVSVRCAECSGSGNKDLKARVLM